MSFVIIEREFYPFNLMLLTLTAKYVVRYLCRLIKEFIWVAESRKLYKDLQKHHKNIIVFCVK